MTRLYNSTLDRIRANTEIIGDCLCWTGYLGDQGYGRISIRVKGERYPVTFYVHRVAWEIINGPIPDGFHLDHLREEGICHHKSCWNVNHLRLIERVDHGRKTRRFQLTAEDREWMRNHGVQSTLL